MSDGRHCLKSLVGRQCEPNHTQTVHGADELQELLRRIAVFPLAATARDHLDSAYSFEESCARPRHGHDRKVSVGSQRQVKEARRNQISPVMLSDHYPTRISGLGMLVGWNLRGRRSRPPATKRIVAWSVRDEVRGLPLAHGRPCLLACSRPCCRGHLLAMSDFGSCRKRAQALRCEAQMHEDMRPN
ncbi:hypothetical protein CERZMDRAFT_90759 [Cercospora zeae-maydis SCOH1-5]|uniref:Uncharacterized protein n=1 Tax=Cercospora zeae-maydis SCOH1-5 TaxID=717836 RepID=A0A6A6FGK7_9PEZI|nr:hypothetical protein CERZMDRAFT_90759 [Cercospora zeae-maydis SCOH1-5]